MQQGQLSKLKMKMTLGFLALFWRPAQARVARDDQHVFVVVQMMVLSATSMYQTNPDFAQDARRTNVLALVLLVTPRRLRRLVMDLT